MYVIEKRGILLPPVLNSQNENLRRLKMDTWMALQSEYAWNIRLLMVALHHS